MFRWQEFQVMVLYCTTNLSGKFFFVLWLTRIVGVKKRGSLVSALKHHLCIVSYLHMYSMWRVFARFYTVPPFSLRVFFSSQKTSCDASRGSGSVTSHQHQVNCFMNWRVWSVRTALKSIPIDLSRRHNEENMFSTSSMVEDIVLYKIIDSMFIRIFEEMTTLCTGMFVE